MRINHIEFSDSLTWTNEAVLLLITLKKENNSLFTSNTVTQKQAWRNISEEMCKKGHHLTGDECFAHLRIGLKIHNTRDVLFDKSLTLTLN